MFEKFFPSKKAEEPQKPEGPSIEELAALLPEEEKNEFLSLKDIENELGQESESGIEIDHTHLTETEEKNLERYYELFKKAREISEHK